MLDIDYGKLLKAVIIAAVGVGAFLGFVVTIITWPWVLFVILFLWAVFIVYTILEG